MPLEFIRDADDAALRDGGMRSDGLLDGAGAEAVGGDVDDVVAARHDVHVAVRVEHACVAGVDPGTASAAARGVVEKALEVAGVEALGVVEEGGEARGGEWGREHDVAHCSAREFGAGVGDDADVEAGHRFSG